MSWASIYWGQFQAEQKDDWNDGEQTCGAKLHYQTCDKGSWAIIVGKTASGKGHAEMDALDQFFRNVCWNRPENLAAYKRRGLEIECSAKACCLRCSIILGALNFKAVYETGTFKSAKPMGKTGWNLVPNSRTFLKAAVGITENMITDIGRMTEL